MPLLHAKNAQQEHIRHQARLQAAQRVNLENIVLLDLLLKSSVLVVARVRIQL